jgi:hypothetical protein
MSMLEVYENIIFSLFKITQKIGPVFKMRLSNERGRQAPLNFEVLRTRYRSSKG